MVFAPLTTSTVTIKTTTTTVSRGKKQISVLESALPDSSHQIATTARTTPRDQRPVALSGSAEAEAMRGATNA